MALSNSQNFTLTRTQLLDIALKQIGGLRAGQSVTSDTDLESDATTILNMLIKSYEHLGLQLWVRKTATITLVSGTRTYALGGAVTSGIPLRIVSAYITKDGLDTPVTILTKDEYERLNNKTSEGKTTQIWYDYQNTTGTLYIWPVVDASGYTLTITYQKSYDDMDAASNDLDFPSNWYYALFWNLAVDLCALVARPVQPEWMIKAAAALDSAQDASYEEGSIFLAPSRRR